MTAPDKQEPPHRWKAFLDSLPSTVSQRLSAHDIRHIFRYFDAAKPKSGHAAQPKWQDISTAPKDGTHFLSHQKYWKNYWMTDPNSDMFGETGGGVIETYWNGNAFVNLRTVHIYPTHWQPLPIEPAQGGQSNDRP